MMLHLEILEKHLFSTNLFQEKPKNYKIHPLQAAVTINILRLCRLKLCELIRPRPKGNCQGQKKIIGRVSRNPPGKNFYITHPPA